MGDTSRQCNVEVKFINFKNNVDNMKYHKINNIHTTGVVLFIISLMVLIIGDLFKSNQKIFFNALLYGGFVFQIGRAHV